MADPTTPVHPGSPLAWLRGAVRGVWRDLLSLYYANTPVWRILKSGALVALGLFVWSGSNLLLSYRPDWTILYYPMAYGFVLLFWGPLTHLAIVPLIIRVRRAGPSGSMRTIARHGSKLNLSTFLVIVLILGSVPPGVMTFEFQVPAGGDGGSTITTQLQCTKSDGRIHCHLSDARGIDRVVVSSGGETLVSLESAPYDFDLQESELATVNGDKQFTVELRDENGQTVRTFIRRTDLIPG